MSKAELDRLVAAIRERLNRCNETKCGIAKAQIRAQVARLRRDRGIV